MRGLTVYEERAAEVANGPDVCFVLPDAVSGGMSPLYAVQLPDDIGRFVLIDDPQGFDVMFKFRGRWYSLTSGVWIQTKDIEKDPAEAHWMNPVEFGRTVLKRHKVKEMTWKQWQKRRR